MLFKFEHLDAMVWYPWTNPPAAITTAANHPCSLEMIPSESSTSSSSPATRAGGTVLGIPSPCVHGTLPTQTEFGKMDVPLPVLVQLQQLVLQPIRFACGGDAICNFKRMMMCPMTGSPDDRSGPSSPYRVLQGHLQA